MWLGHYKLDQDGNKIWLYTYREREGIPCCAGCHKYIRLMNGNQIVTGMRNGKPIDYTYYKFRHAKYCENIDGRLGQVCLGYPKNISRLLTVDHIKEDFNQENSSSPESLQTLCQNCHSLKDEMVAIGNRDGLSKMLTMAYAAKNMQVSSEDIHLQVENILKNRFKNKR